MPNFEPLFASLREKGQLPWATDALLDFSRFLQGYWWMLFGAIAAAVFGALKYFSSDQGKVVLDRIKIKVPVFGSIFLNLAVARFCRVLGNAIGQRCANFEVA